MRFRVEGLVVEIDVPGNLHVRKPKLGALIEWQCPCGFETLKLEREDVVGASGGEGYRNLWPIVKDAAELTKEWNRIYREAKDFVDYFERLYAFKGEHNTTWARIREAGFATTISVTCPTCRREYSFGVRVSNPKQPEPQLSSLGAFKKFGIKNKKVERVLARWIAENEGRLPYKKASEYIEYVISLEPSIPYVQNLISKLKEVISENPPETEYAASWVEDLTESLEELEKDFEEITKRQLENELTQTEDLIPKPKELRLAMIPTSAESLPPLSMEDMRRR